MGLQLSVYGILHPYDHHWPQQKDPDTDGHNTTDCVVADHFLVLRATAHPLHCHLLDTA